MHGEKWLCFVLLVEPFPSLFLMLSVSVGAGYFCVPVNQLKACRRRQTPYLLPLLSLHPTCDLSLLWFHLEGTMTHAKSIFSVQQLEPTAGLFQKERNMVQCIWSITCPHDDSGADWSLFFTYETGVRDTQTEWSHSRPFTKNLSINFLVLLFKSFPQSFPRACLIQEKLHYYPLNRYFWSNTWAIYTARLYFGSWQEFDVIAWCLTMGQARNCHHPGSMHVTSLRQQKVK